MARAKTGWVYVRKNKTKPHQPGIWKQEKHLEAVTTYMATGNLSLTGRLINVPLDTLNKWKASEWWKELTDKYYEEDSITLDAKLKKTLEKSLATVSDRLDNGDYQYDPKTGKLIRVPVKLRDAHKVTTDLIDKQRVLRKQPVLQDKSNESTEGRLLKLAEAFAKFATGKQQEEKVVNEIVEGEFERLPPEYQESLCPSCPTEKEIIRKS